MLASHLAQIDPALAHAIASTAAPRMPPARKPTSTRGPTRNPTKAGTATAHSTGIAAPSNAGFSAARTLRPISYCPARICTRVSRTSAAVDRPTASTATPASTSGRNAPTAAPPNTMPSAITSPSIPPRFAVAFTASTPDRAGAAP